MTAKRRPEISLLNVLFCFLVIFIHIISYAVAGLEKGTLQYNIAMIPSRLASFVVQGFVFLSGMKISLTEKDKLPYGRYLLSRIRGVILPYAVSFIVYYVFYFVGYGYPLDAAFILKHFVLGSLVCHFYFIPMIFQFDLLLPVLKRIANKYSAIIVIPFTLLVSAIFESFFPYMLAIAFPNVSFIYNDRIFTTYLAYWIIGYYIGKHYDEFIDVFKRNFKAICVMFSISLVFCVYFSYIAFNNIAYVSFISMVHNLYVICVIMFMYALSVIVSEKAVGKLPVLLRIDRVSYDIYLWHMLVMFMTDFFIKKLGIIGHGLPFVIRAVVVYGITVTLCVLWGNLKRRFNKKTADQAA